MLPGSDGVVAVLGVLSGEGAVVMFAGGHGRGGGSALYTGGGVGDAGPPRGRGREYTVAAVLLMLWEGSAGGDGVVAYNRE